MTITFECQCSRRLHASEEMAGRRIRCPNCHTVQRVPRDDSAPRICMSEEDESADLLNPLLPEDTALLELERLFTRPQLERGSETTSGATFRPGQGPIAFFTLAGYVLERELGRGGAGVVYLARDLKQDRRVAIKVMLSGAGCRPEELARFRTETLVVAGLEHPGLVRVYEVGEQDGVPYCVMEYVEGGQLRQRLRAQPITHQQAATLAAQLADAVHTVHQARVIHRDLKPENILLALDGTPRITDFGLARRLDGGPRLTQTGQVFGTPCYMAPEQAAGHTQEIGPLADVYALGAILYEMLTGCPPFEGATDAQTLALVLSQEPRSPRQINPEIPVNLETVCLRCLQKEPERRYASAAELAEDLRRVLDGQPILARPVSRMERSWWRCRRKPVQVALTAVLAVLFTLLAIGGPLTAFILWQRNTELARRNALLEGPGKDAGAIGDPGVPGIPQPDQQTKDELIDTLTERLRQGGPDQAWLRQILVDIYKNRAQTFTEEGRHPQAASDWAKAAELVNKSQRPIFLVHAARARARAGQLKSALARAEELAQEDNLPGASFYELACVYALALPTARDQVQATRYAEHAMSLLTRARKEEYFHQAAARNTLREESDLEALRSTPAFREFLDSLKD